MEGDFRPLLISCVRGCSRRRWGWFGQNDNFESAKYLEWADAQRLKEIALKIRQFGAEFGQPNALAERFLHYCAQRGANVPGEPQLAETFLQEIERGDFAHG